MDIELIKDQVHQAVTDLIQIAGLQPGQILVIGCSTSEVAGKKIGSASNLDVAQAIFQVLDRLTSEQGIFLAVQCCEHLNRALVVREKAAAVYHLEIVSVVPVPQAGGALAATAMSVWPDAVVVERIAAHAGIDIGDTLIGMHLRPVAVPVRGKIKEIGSAHLTMARTRPKLIGGARAVYIKD